jgi:hypothetical protein
MTKFARTAFLMMTGLTLVSTAFAAPSSTDWSLGPGGVYSWAGGTSSLIGSNIPVLSVLGDSTPSHNGTLLGVVGGDLDFTSGAFNGTSTTWSWAGGGTLNLTGCVPGVTPVSCNPNTNVLVSDDFTSVSIVQVAGALDAVFGNVTGTINPQVAAYFGEPASFSTGTFSTSILTTGTPGSKFVGSDLVGLIKANPVSAPENWGMGESIGFFAFVLIAFAAMIRFGAIKSHLFQGAAGSQRT